MIVIFYFMEIAGVSKNEFGMLICDQRFLCSLSGETDFLRLSHTIIIVYTVYVLLIGALWNPHQENC